MEPHTTRRPPSSLYPSLIPFAYLAQGSLVGVMTSMFPAQLVIRAAGALRRALTLTLTLSPDRRYAAGTPRRALTLTLTLTRARARARARALSPSLTLTLTRRDRTGDG